MSKSNKEKQPKEMVAKSKNKVISCSTPERRLDSPSRDSDSIYDSDAASPVPFLCTQDGAEGQTDVIWNFYTPKSEETKSKLKNTTPVSRRIKRSVRPKHIEKPPPKRRPVKPSQKKIELFQELVELNHNLHNLVRKSTPKAVEKAQSEEDIFSDCSDSSPRSAIKSNKRCLRKNVLSSKFIKPETETGLESDDSMNEYLLKASQAVEDNILNYEPIQAKRPHIEPITRKNLKPSLQVNIDQDSMDAILSNINLDSPSLKVKKSESPLVNNDSFDNLLGNINDSTFELLTQIPLQNVSTTNATSVKMDTNWSFKDSILCDSSPSSKTIFGRYSSMPESPSVNASNRPSTSGMVFGRYSSMPLNESDEKKVPGDSPIRCTPEEIKKKHQRARERLLAKRVLPFTSSQQLNATQTSPQKFIPKKTIFQPKLPSTANSIDTKQNAVTNTQQKPNTDNIKILIEKKRREALMKLRKRQAQNKC